MSFKSSDRIIGTKKKCDFEEVPEVITAEWLRKHPDQAKQLVSQALRRSEKPVNRPLKPYTADELDMLDEMGLQ